ncbi:LacI family transcriptional regulator [Brevundimonas nasdae]|uniref:LacI family DNA-binding transcriptional regulator n=1 Tax=Brevundimonas nasdae TaxID=172043 RepID=UPI001F1FF16A|nr:LacI family DNA-binding transcriptional regulator [Brevundimonas nasdae]MDQ0452315.1 LacI family transcriptional regulator [Brevundimonas nasdae]
MQDVADRAGVSVMTVSNVLTGRKLVSEPTRATVLEAMEALRYVPNIAARSLASAAPERIGVHFRDVENAFLSALVIGAVNATSRLGAQMLVGRWSSDPEASPLNVLRQLVRSGAQGVLMAPPFCEALTVEEMAEFPNVALIGLSTGETLPRLASVRIDDRQASFDMTSRLVALGHRRIGFIKGPPNHLSSGTRFDGYRQALQSAGLEFEPSFVAEGELTFDSGLIATAKLLGGTVRPTAILASNDDMAAAAINIAKEGGLRVPEDLSVAGFDDSPLAIRVVPKLSSVRQPVSQMAEQAIRLLIDQIRDPGGAQAMVTHMVDHQLIERDSTGLAPGH